jgi:hypothetical protein
MSNFMRENVWALVLVVTLFRGSSSAMAVRVNQLSIAKNANRAPLPVVLWHGESSLKVVVLNRRLLRLLCLL